MARGRKPKSAELKLLGGNAGKRPINDDAPKPSVPPENSSLLILAELVIRHGHLTRE